MTNETGKTRKTRKTSRLILLFRFNKSQPLAYDAKVRIISGIHRGRKLKTVAGQEVRPTSDRLRETLFNILAPDIRDAQVLDICAGSGAIAIEALSRGAASITLIDQSRRACQIIQENLRALGINDEARVLNRDALAAIKQLETENQAFDIVYFDPPYASPLYAQVMNQLGASSIIHPHSIVIVEHHTKTPIEKEYGKLKIYRELKQGESALGFYSVAGNR
ncbi:MAG: 16S rRNA (guanine(966)-N(2))-methyltransferase RsmD [Acidobacteriota bacterium]